MTKASNAADICTREEYERFQSIYERFKQNLNEPDGLCLEDFGDLLRDIKEFWPTLVEVGGRLGIDLSDRVDDVLNVCKRPQVPPPYYNFSDIYSAAMIGSDEAAFMTNAAHEEHYRYEMRRKAREETVKALDSLMFSLHKYFEPKVEWITVTQASKTAGVHKGTITRWVNDGKVKSNGKTGHKRRIDKFSLLSIKEENEMKDIMKDCEELRLDASKVRFRN